MDRPALVLLQELAHGQRGMFAVHQAEMLGISRRTLEWWCAKGWLRRVRRNVLAFAGAPRSSWDPVVAAALACPAGVLSHRTAAAIHGFDGILLAEPELTLPPDVRHCLDGIRLHYTGPVEDPDCTTRRGLRVTSPVRTLVDLAGGSVGPDLLASVLDDGAVRRHWTFEEVDACLGRQVRRREGSERLGRLLAVRLGEAVPDSPLEQRIFRALAPVGPFEAHYQMVLEGVVIVVDAAWPWCNVAAEIDGRTYRVRSRRAFDRETRKLNLLAAAGWSVAHLSATMSSAQCCQAVLGLMPAETFPSRQRFR